MCTSPAGLSTAYCMQLVTIAEMPRPGFDAVGSRPSQQALIVRRYADRFLVFPRPFDQAAVGGVGLLTTPLPQVEIFPIHGHADVVGRVPPRWGRKARKTWHDDLASSPGPFVGPFALVWSTTPPNVGGMQSLLLIGLTTSGRHGTRTCDLRRVNRAEKTAKAPKKQGFSCVQSPF